MWLLPAITAMFKAGWDENLNAITAAFQPFPELAARARAIPEMPSATLAANLGHQPPEVRERVQRMIDAVIDGELGRELARLAPDRAGLHWTPEACM